MSARLLQYYVRHFPVEKGKNRAITLLWKPLFYGRATTRETVLTYGNIRVKCDLSHWIQRQLYFWGSYEKEYWKYWIKLAKMASTIFDVGANVGVYSLLAAAANPKAQIHAFEPSTEMVEVLRGNIVLNDFGNISVHSFAVGKGSGQGVLRECRGSDGTNEGMNYVLSNGSEAQSADRSVALQSLDDFAQNHGIEKLDLIKMDIEGGEYDALRGAERLLAQGSIACILIECTEWAAKRSGHTVAEIIDLLHKYHYDMYQITPAGLASIDIGQLRDGENLFAFSPTSQKMKASLLDATTK